MKKEPMTSAGYTRLEEELKHLKSVERPAISRALSEARDMGDISENAEYHAAKERQAFVEARMAQLGEKLRQSEVIEITKLSGKEVKFGATVRLIHLDSGEENDYQIVGDLEADIAQGRLSVSSPFARALIGQHEGDTVTVHAPGGDREYEILRVEYR